MHPRTEDSICTTLHDIYENIFILNIQLIVIDKKYYVWLKYISLFDKELSY